MTVKSPPSWWASLSLVSSLLFEFQYHDDIRRGYFINVYTDQFFNIDRLRRSKHRVDTVFLPCSERLIRDDCWVHIHMIVNELNICKSSLF